MTILNTLTVLALVVMSFALIVAVPVLYASEDTSGRSNRLILLGGLAWVALVLVNWGMSYFVASGADPQIRRLAPVQGQLA